MKVVNSISRNPILTFGSLTGRRQDFDCRERCRVSYTGRPLFPVTCGDIGDTAKDVESNLDRCFQLAHKWGCVLLLDEADVFLARRDKQDLKRNALVSGEFIPTND